jgi:hypothetical protein
VPAVSQDERHTPRRSSSWDNFVPQVLANAGGTLLAATVLYVYGVAVGLIKANPRVYLPILLLIALAGIVWAVRQLVVRPGPETPRIAVLLIALALLLAVLAWYFTRYALNSNWPIIAIYAAVLAPFAIAALSLFIGRWPAPTKDGPRR